jgi:hypothetical protein
VGGGEGIRRTRKGRRDLRTAARRRLTGLPRRQLLRLPVKEVLGLRGGRMCNTTVLSLMGGRVVEAQDGPAIES